MLTVIHDMEAQCKPLKSLFKGREQQNASLLVLSPFEIFIEFHDYPLPKRNLHLNISTIKADVH